MVSVAIGEKDSDPVFYISDLLPHLAQEQMTKTAAKVIEGEDLNLIIGGKPVKEEDKSIPTIEMYKHQFMFWCLCGSPLMMGGDIRNMSEEAHKLLTNKNLIAINQDEEARPITRIPGDNTCVSYLKMLSGGEFAIGSFNKASFEKHISILAEEIGIPANSGMKIEAYDCETGEHYGTFADIIRISVEKFGARILRCKLVK